MGSGKWLGEWSEAEQRKINGLASLSEAKKRKIGKLVRMLEYTYRSGRKVRKPLYLMLTPTGE